MRPGHSIGTDEVSREPEPSWIVSRQRRQPDRALADVRNDDAVSDSVTAAAPEQLIVYSRDLLGRTDADIAGLWQRAIAFLARQALEVAVARSLASRASGAEVCSARAQLLCLPEYISTPTALEAAVLWASLSRACHQHPYELAPTWDELSGWLDRVEVLVGELK